jgi:pimeloyl-ACP methyl ester carboxylesterase
MPNIDVNGVSLHYEERGDPSAPPLLLVMGVGAQMVHWPEGLVDAFAAQGLRVIRFDNRDVGLSSKLEHLGDPNIKALAVRFALGLKVHPPYEMRDMAADAAGLIEALDLDSAHVVGCSMGGMIAQALTIHFPQRVRSLTSIMSSPGGRFFGKPKAMLALMSKSAPTLEGSIARGLKINQALRGTAFPAEPDRVRDVYRRAFERSYCPAGFRRQMAAIVAAPSRRAGLAQIRVPTLVIHGSEDPLVPLAAGRATARAIPESRLHVIDGMGHELPSGVWPTLARLVGQHVVTEVQGSPRLA